MTEPGEQDRTTRRVEYVSTDAVRPADAQSTCLRPLGLCELGGACDACWYRPDHPRFARDAAARE